MSPSRFLPQLSLAQWSLVVAASVTVYFIGSASALGRDPFFLLLGAFITIIALVARDLFWVRRAPHRRTPIHPIAIALAFLLLGLVVTTVLVGLSGDRRDMADVTRQVAMLLVGTTPFILAYRVARREPAGPAIMGIAHAVLAICAVSIGLEAAGLTNYETYGSRYFGFLSDPAALLLTLPIMIYAATGRRLLLAASLAFLLLTISRGPIIFALVGMLCLAIFGRGKARMRAIILIVMALFVAIVLEDYVAVLLDRFLAIDANEGRFTTTRAGWRLFLESPIFGQGYATLGYHYPMLDTRSSWLYGRFRDGVFPTATSTWMQMLSDGGLFLAIPYFILILVVVRHLVVRIRPWMADDETRAMAGVAVWLLVILLVNHSSGWFLAGGMILPLVMTALGLVAGTMTADSARAILHRDHDSTRRPA